MLIFMKKLYRKRIICYIVLVGMLVSLMDPGILVYASSISDMQNKIENTKNEIEGIEGNLSEKEDALDLVEEGIADTNAEIINTMTSIGLKEDEITAKELDIQNKEQDIRETQAEYDAAKIKEEEQYQAMKRRARYNYEHEAPSVLEMLINGMGMELLLNQEDYIIKINDYDQKLKDEYEASKNQVYELWMQLEVEKTGLEQDKVLLEQDRQNLQEQKERLDSLLADQMRKSAGFEAEIASLRQQATASKKRLQQEQAALKKLQQQQKKPASNAANGNYTPTNYTSVIDNASGSDLGKKIAKYACQFIGNPYVAGGTSLTGGADCSGFVYRVYADFGYNLPRTSYEQREVGAGVSYDSAQPGDIVCYDGHVGLYIGGGYLVHASTARTGIKVSNANYRSILTVRRVA
jgi:cell wall-associated NlpC family hydrolase